MESSHDLQGVVDIGTLCLAFTMAEDGVEVSLAAEDDTSITLQAPERDENFLLPSSLCSTHMRPVQNPSDPFKVATSAAEAAQGEVRSLFGGTLQKPDFSDECLYQMAETYEHLTSSTFHMDICNSDDAVYMMSGAGKVLSRGELQLWPNTYIVFDGTCTDVHLKNVTFRGVINVDNYASPLAEILTKNILVLTVLVVIEGSDRTLLDTPPTAPTTSACNLTTVILGPPVRILTAIALKVEFSRTSTIQYSSRHYDIHVSRQFPQRGFHLGPQTVWYCCD